MPADVTAHNLPIARTPMIGRSRELGEIRRLLDGGARLVTVVGPGGVGKTRLAIEYAAQAFRRGEKDVAFVQLAELRDPALAALAIRDSVSDEAQTISEASFFERLRNRSILIVLDNLEQVVGAASFIARVLDAGPDVQLLATSRLPLRIAGEQEFPLTPLDTSDGVKSSDAIALFVERARAVDPRFALTAANAEDIAAICRRLDGLPLAIELAAARAKVLSPASMRARLEQTPLNPGPGRRDAPERQQTLANTIDWSYRLLNSDEQRLMRALAVFSGGFSLDAAEGIAENDNLPVLDGVVSLVDHSLVLRLGRDEGDRFAMLGTIRSFALERLEISGEDKAIRDRHAAYFVALVEEIDKPADGERRPDANARIHAEIDNIRSALEWLFAQGRPNDLARLATVVAGYWLDRGALSEAKLWLERVIARLDAIELRYRVRAVNTSSFIASFQGENDLAVERGRLALALAKELGDPRQEVNVLNAHAGAAVYRGEIQLAIDLWEDAVVRAETIPGPYSSHGLMHNLALAYLYDGSLQRARDVLKRSRELPASANDRLRSMHASLLGVEIDLAEGKLSQACEQLMLLVDEFESNLDNLMLFDFVAVGANLAFAFGDYDQSARLIGSVDAVRSRLGYVLPKPEVDLDRARRIALERVMGQDALARLSTEGGHLDASEIFAIIRSLKPNIPIESPRLAYGLTERELDVLRLLGGGGTNQEIAEKLFISPRTVQSHVANILAKLNVSTRAAAATLAAREGLG
jgi:predicted ATPase/DNA-binding CsgD family transcriptional regulator